MLVTACQTLTYSLLVELTGVGCNHILDLNQFNSEPETNQKRVGFFCSSVYDEVGNKGEKSIFVERTLNPSEIHNCWRHKSVYRHCFISELNIINYV